MKKYSVKRIARLTGITARTLHYYDEIGLLKPLLRGKNKYRYYGQKELTRLQQIVSLRQLGLSLNQIKVIIDSPVGTSKSIFKEHRKMIEAKIGKLQEIITILDTAIKNDQRIQIDNQLPIKILLAKKTREEVIEIEKLYQQVTFEQYINTNLGITKEYLAEKWFKDGLSDETIERRQKLINSSPDNRLLVAKRGSKIIAVSWIRKQKDRNLINNIDILSEYAFTDVAMMLYEAALKFFNDGKPVVIQVPAYNSEEITKYESFGFRKSKIIKLDIVPMRELILKK